jgi:hypothetical protein
MLNTKSSFIPGDPSKVYREGPIVDAMRIVIEKYTGKRVERLEVYRPDTFSSERAARAWLEGHEVSGPSDFSCDVSNPSVDTLEERMFKEWPPATRKFPSLF